jgi:hypothetical protein
VSFKSPNLQDEHFSILLVDNESRAQWEGEDDATSTVTRLANFPRIVLEE